MQSVYYLVLVIALMTSATCGFIMTPSIGRGCALTSTSGSIRHCTSRLHYSQEAFQEEVSRIKSLRVKEIKQELKRLNIWADDCFEKDDLVKRLADAVLQLERGAGAPGDTRTSKNRGNPNNAARVTSDGVVLPMIRLQPSEVLEGVSIDKKDYYAVRLDLPDLQGRKDIVFVIDTAATHTLITPAAAERLGTKPLATRATASGGTGFMTDLKVHELGRVSVADSLMGSLNAVVMELPIADDQQQHDVAGIVGLDFLSRFDVLIDFNTDEMTLARVGAASAGGLGTAEMCKLRGNILQPIGFFTIEGRIAQPGQDTASASAPLTVIVDTGSAFTIINWNGAKTANLNRSSPGLRDTNQVVAGASAPGINYAGMTMMETDLQLSLYSVGDSQPACTIPEHLISIGDLPGFSSTGLGGPAMILGSDVIKRGGGKMALSINDRAMWLAI